MPPRLTICKSCSAGSHGASSSAPRGSRAAGKRDGGSRALPRAGSCRSGQPRGTGPPPPPPPRGFGVLGEEQRDSRRACAPIARCPPTGVKTNHVVRYDMPWYHALHLLRAGGNHVRKMARFVSLHPKLTCCCGRATR